MENFKFENLLKLLGISKISSGCMSEDEILKVADEAAQAYADPEAFLTANQDINYDDTFPIPLGEWVVVGSLPETATRGWISYGMAGLNPFMNVESNGRAEQNLAGIDDVQRDKRLEYSSLPWAERPVVIKAGKQTHE